MRKPFIISPTQESAYRELGYCDAIPPDGLDQLVRKIFDIIPSYYDKVEAAKIKQLIADYLVQEQSSL